MLILSLLALFNFDLFSQTETGGYSRIVFRGVVIDASTLKPLPYSRVYVNSEMSTESDTLGSFMLHVSRSDTVTVKNLGYKAAYFVVNDTLAGKEFNAGIYLSSDTIEIGEVIIVPRRPDLRKEILNAPLREPGIMDNARSNVAVSAYQGRTTPSQLGDPGNNYAVLVQRHKTMAYEKGGIPSDQIVGLNPFILVPAAYLLIKGFPEKPDPMRTQLTSGEVEEIHRKYMESKLRRK